MKRKRSKKLIHASISEARILQLSNDAAENIRSGSVEEWRTIARYFQNALQRENNKMMRLQPSVAAMVFGLELIAKSKLDLIRWQNEHYPRKSA